MIYLVIQKKYFHLFKREEEYQLLSYYYSTFASSIYNYTVFNT